MSVCDPGCVKTPTSNLQVESLSRLRRIRKEPLWQSPSKEEKRENNSAHSLLVHVFTQPGPFPDTNNSSPIWTAPMYFPTSRGTGGRTKPNSLSRFSALIIDPCCCALCCLSLFQDCHN